MSFATKRLKVLRVFLYISGVCLFFWWPLSHWLYSDFYHQLLGFTSGSYPESMVRVIGTCGFIPVILLFISARDPVRHKDMLITLIIMSFLLMLMYLYLVLSGQFPTGELFNAALSFIYALILLLLYPR